ncbi:MAG: DNA polymerase III subunits gamma and tau [Ignavibacteriae bacterium]|nr:MAG: DNA polymerase III subunits gamma and tau [Ignavibacteriota bacterium]
MKYLVTARKWRPLKFEDVVGQEHITTTLRNAIARNRISHAYLFSGPRGVGKTTTARILAKAINCLNPKDFNPDNECEICLEITEGRNMDVLEIDGASNRGIEEIRNLRESVKYVPTKNKYKVYVIDEVHMLTKEAFNALLKTLEEPPAHVIFIFATTEIFKVPATILSRCQRFDFRRISTDEIMKHLQLIAKTEKIKIDDDALLIIAKKGDGSMRDAQSIFDQVVSFCGNEIDTKSTIQALGLVDQEIFFRTTDIIRNKDTKAAIVLVDEIITQGYDIKEYLSGLTEHLRNFIITITTGNTKLIEVAEIYKKKYAEDAKHFKENDLLRLIKIVTEAQNSIKWDVQPRYKLELALIQMTKLDNSVEIEKLLNQIQELKKKFSNGIKLEGNVYASTPSKYSGPGNFDVIKPIIQDKSENNNILTPDSKIPIKGIIQDSQNMAFSYTPLNIPLERAMEKWQNVVQIAGNGRVFFKNVLSAARIVDCTNGVLKISCMNSSQLDFIKQNKDYLTELAQNIYGARLKLEAIVDSTIQKESEEGKTVVEEHQIIKELKSKLGAVEISPDSY